MTEEGKEENAPSTVTMEEEEEEGIAAPMDDENEPLQPVVEREDQEEEDEEEESSKWISQKLAQDPPPDPLPVGWIVKRSRSQPSCYYYYNQEAGTSRWEVPVLIHMPPVATTANPTQPQQLKEEQSDSNQPMANGSKSKAATGANSESGGQDLASTAQSTTTITSLDKKRAAPTTPQDGTTSTASPNANSHTSSPSSSKRSKNEDEPKEVRVLHLLKKHKGSRRPASWRNPKITSTVAEATAELEEYLDILGEASSGEELRATFEELSRTESDCSSAKRGGDLGFFGRRKMQPAFEKASFDLKIGELSRIVETSSGVHILLRIG